MQEDGIDELNRNALEIEGKISRFADGFSVKDKGRCAFQAVRSEIGAGTSDILLDKDRQDGELRVIHSSVPVWQI